MLTDEQLNLLTEEERAAWKRCEKATAGPWVQWKGHSSVFSGTPTENTVGTLRGYHAFLFEINDDDLPRKEARADAAFIAHARADLPAAMETIAALREQLAGADRERDEAIRDRKGFEADACRYAAELTNTRVERDKAEHERDCNIVERDIIRGEVLAEVYDRLLRHADTYTARGVPGYYNAIRQAAEVVKGMVSDETH